MSDVNKVKANQLWFYIKIFRNLMIKSCSNKTIGHTYGTDFPEFHIFEFFLKLIGLF